MAQVVMMLCRMEMLTAWQGQQAPYMLLMFLFTLNQRAFECMHARCYGHISFC
jgi:hypothetical protein